MVGTQQFVDIKKIEDGIIFLKDGSLTKILAVEGINFDLKSEDDQNMILYSFQNILNTLDFSIQIIIHSRKLNISPYLKTLISRKEKETNELLKNQLNEYIDFIKSFVAENSIVEKDFFVAIPYAPITIPISKSGFLSKFIPFKKKGEEKNSEDDEEEKIFQLNQRVEQVRIGLGQIGLSVLPLDNKATIELIYNLYNPKAVEKEELKIAEENY